MNGELTLGENIADNGGIRESFRAYMSSVDALGPEPVLPGLEQYTPEQMYFISNAKLYCEVATEESFVGQIQSNPHSPGMSQKGIGYGILIRGRPKVRFWASWGGRHYIADFWNSYFFTK